jgi:hypothetical protein
VDKEYVQNYINQIMWYYTIMDDVLNVLGMSNEKASERL